ncbi:MAG: formyl-CoA transferase [Rhodospirillaceae bacterium]|nr:formyl-CoA transferase [Rhodospirillaceae bacterium]|tara:strand:- start:1959 stop:3155 length:1197 start_codon:yes stop_codon:yes gene_type:complete
MSSDNLPFTGIKVLDLTAHRAGPTSVRLLSDWGADTIKIEQPEAISKDKGSILGARNGFDLQNLHRNKRSMTIDLKNPEGLELFYELVKTSDVVVENFRSQTKHRLKVDYESCAKINPRIVYGSLSGFGQDGPYDNRPGVDQILQGMGGLMSVTGIPGQGPVRVGIPICDLTSGMFLGFGMAAALFERERSGKGQWVQTSLLQAIIAMMDFQAARVLKDGDVPKQMGNDHPTSVPTGVFKTKDGHINIAASGGVLYERFCTSIGRADLVEDPRFIGFQERSDNRDALRKEIEGETQKETSKHWVDMMQEVGVPCGPIYNMGDVFDDPQVKHLGMAWPMRGGSAGDFPVVKTPIIMSRTQQADEVRLPTPDLSQHTEEVLKEMGYDADAIADLKERNIV